MCMACEEMDLFYAYLDAVEEAKRKAQPWECEVTVIPPTYRTNSSRQDNHCSWLCRVGRFELNTCAAIPSACCGRPVACFR